MQLFKTYQATPVGFYVDVRMLVGVKMKIIASCGGKIKPLNYNTTIQPSKGLVWCRYKVSFKCVQYTHLRDWTVDTHFWYGALRDMWL